MPQLNGGGGDDLGANDELISFKDEGEQEEKISENSSAERDLADVKSSLVNESETNQNSSSDSEVRGKPPAGPFRGGGRGPRCARGRAGAGGAAPGPAPAGAQLSPRHQLVTMPSVLFCLFPLPPSPRTSPFFFAFHSSSSPFSPPPPKNHPPHPDHPLPQPPHADPRLAPRRSGGPRLGPKLSEINPGKV